MNTEQIYYSRITTSEWRHVWGVSLWPSRGLENLVLTLKNFFAMSFHLLLIAIC